MSELDRILLGALIEPAPDLLAVPHATSHRRKIEILDRLLPKPIVFLRQRCCPLLN
jgi:hypothetical protein